MNYIRNVLQIQSFFKNGSRFCIFLPAGKTYRSHARIPKQAIEHVYPIVYTIYRKGDDDLVELRRVDNNILISKVKKEQELTLEDIFQDYDGAYKAEKFDWGSPSGKEVW